MTHHEAELTVIHGASRRTVSRVACDRRQKPLSRTTLNYNFCILSSKILKVVSPTTIVIRQKFPIQYNPLRVGETLMVMNDENTVIGSAKIARYK